jgi:hypothetical protein
VRGQDDACRPSSLRHPLTFLRHPERSRFSGEAKDLARSGTGLAGLTDQHALSGLRSAEQGGVEAIRCDRRNRPPVLAAERFAYNILRKDPRGISTHHAGN